MTQDNLSTRRRFLARGGTLAASALALPAMPALAAAPASRRLAMVHTHTSERLDLVYAVGDRYVPAALSTLNRFLRDHYSGEVGQIDPQVLDLLHALHRDLDSDQPIQIISGYRCPSTNSRLRRGRGGGVATRSLHMQGKAIDIRLSGVPLADLRDAARSLRAGGVGYYPREQFVHVDTGRVRDW